MFMEQKEEKKRENQLTENKTAAYSIVKILMQFMCGLGTLASVLECAAVEIHS
jgi:hypothetical protein